MRYEIKLFLYFLYPPSKFIKTASKIKGFLYVVLSTFSLSFYSYKTFAKLIKIYLNLVFCFKNISKISKFQNFPPYF